MYKKIISLFLSLFLSLNVFAYDTNDTQFVKQGNWIYDALYILQNECKITSFIETTPISVGELKFYLNQIKYEKLSDNSKILYDKINSYLYTQSAIMKLDDFVLDFNLKLNPEFYFKRNTNNNLGEDNYIDWTFDYYYKDNIFTVPVFLGFSNYVTIESDMSYGKNFGASQDPYAFTNFPINDKMTQMEFLWPRYAYGSTGFFGENWGCTFAIGKEGLTIGNTRLGSIIYNNTFETDCYAQLNIFSKYFKYSLDSIQVDNLKYLYLHQLSFRPFECFKFSAIEGSQINGPYQLRYLNPLMIMHSYSSWIENVTDTERDYYGENNFCAYLAFCFDYTPFSNLRIYGLFAQNEITFAKDKNALASYAPTSIGFQFGVDYLIPLKESSYLTFNLEGIYTSPWLYIKQTPYSSLYRQRLDNLNDDNNNGAGKYICSWIGSPYGPDCCGFDFNFNYKKIDKFSFGFDYEFIMHGKNGFDMFYDPNNFEDINGETICLLYPYPKNYYYTEGPGASESNAQQMRDECYESSTNLWISGDPVFLNRFTLQMQYLFTKNLSIDAKVVYSMLFLNEHYSSRFGQGIEMDFAFTYNLE